MAKQTRAKSEITRQNLLDAALVVIGKQGYAGATVEKIAEEAGVSKGVIYYYFDTKADIATSVLLNTFERIVDRFNEITAKNEAPGVAMQELIREFARQVFANREASRFLLTEIWRSDRIWSDEMRTLEERLAAMFAKLLQGGIDSGRVRSKVDMQFASVSIIGIVLSSAQYYLMTDDDNHEESFANNCIDFISHALEA